MNRLIRRLPLAFFLILLPVFLPGCGGQEQPANPDLVFWTTEVESKRMDIQENLARRFEEQTGVSVKVVPVEENRLNQKVISSKAGENMPDVIFGPMSSTNGWARSGLIDTEANREVIEALDPETMNGLDFVRIQDRFSMVPSDGWVYLLLYRSDLFEEKGLSAPETWKDMKKAAKTLHNSPKQFGTMVPTAPNRIYTQHVLEILAMSNGVRLIQEDGSVGLDTDEMVETLKLYRKLAEYTPSGNIYWKQTRKYYFSGRTPMIFWSPFILDELAGKRGDIDVPLSDLPSRTAVRTTVTGPNSQSGYISVNGFTITAQARKKNAKKFVDFMMNDGYSNFFRMDLFGKFPFRTGTPDEPTRFIDTWETSNPLINRYSEGLAENLVEGINRADRWGLKEGHGRLVSKLYGSKALARILVEKFLRGDKNAREAVNMMAERVRKFRKQIESSSD